MGLRDLQFMVSCFYLHLHALHLISKSQNKNWQIQWWKFWLIVLFDILRNSTFEHMSICQFIPSLTKYRKSIKYFCAYEKHMVRPVQWFILFSSIKWYFMKYQRCRTVQKCFIVYFESLGKCCVKGQKTLVPSQYKRMKLVLNRKD